VGILDGGRWHAVALLKRIPKSKQKYRPSNWMRLKIEGAFVLQL